MMTDRHDGPRAFVAVLTAVVLAVVTVLVPLLDSGSAPGPVSVSEDAAPAGYVGHHHELCIQHGAAAWAPAAGAEAPSALRLRSDRCPVRRDAQPDAHLLATHQPRAPPHA